MVKRNQLYVYESHMKLYESTTFQVAKDHEYSK